MKLENRVALITGGGTGIGKASALLLAQEGAMVTVTGRREDKLAGTVEAIEKAGGKAHYVIGDVSRVSDTERMVKETVNKWGGLDILVNNAGVFKGIKITDVTEEEYDRIMDINLKGTYFMSKYAIPEIRKRGKGAILNIGSTLGLKGIRKGTTTTYAASKGAVVMFTKTLALELSPDQIRVNCICPAVIETELFETLGIPPELIPERKKAWEPFHPLGRNGQPDEVAKAILFLVSDDSAWTTGAILNLDGGVTAE